MMLKLCLPDPLNGGSPAVFDEGNPRVRAQKLRMVTGNVPRRFRVDVIIIVSLCSQLPYLTRTLAHYQALSSVVSLLPCLSLSCVAERRATRPNGEWKHSTRRHMLEPERPEAVWPDRASCLPTFSHFLIVNKPLALSPPPPPPPPPLSLIAYCAKTVRCGGGDACTLLNLHAPWRPL
jgi:hypothetical protein